MDFFVLLFDFTARRPEFLVSTLGTVLALTGAAWFPSEQYNFLLGCVYCLSAMKEFRNLPGAVI